MKKLLCLAFAAAASLLGACVDNDLPGPDITVNIAAIEGEGFTVAELDVPNRTLTLDLEEATDICNVRIDRLTYSLVPHNVTASFDMEQAVGRVASSVDFPGRFDLRSPLHATLRLYQDYPWTIAARQTIDRRFRVAGQIGAAEFDTERRTIVAYVAEHADLARISIDELRLGPEELTTYSPTREELSKMDFGESMHFVDVTCHGRTERWLIYIRTKAVSVELTAADAWSRVVWLYGSGIEGQTHGFRYRKAGGEWQEVGNVRMSGGRFTAHIDAEPETSYEVCAYSGGEQSAPVTVTTQSAPALRNGSFEEWCTVKDIVYPYAEGDTPYWASGNVGAALVKETLTQACDPRPGSSGRYGANLKSKFANVVGIGKFAAGNLFMGTYHANDGTNGLLTFGRKFTARPTALRLWVRFRGGVIDHVGKNTPAGIVQGQSRDNGCIYIAVGTWTKEEYGMVPAVVPKYGGQMLGTDDSPICIATRDISTLFKSNGKDVVGYGELVMEDDIPEWREVTIPLHYTATDIVPTNLLIVSASSRWGDYFTGSTASEMWIDDFELVYDYVEEVIAE